MATTQKKTNTSTNTKGKTTRGRKSAPPPPPARPRFAPIAAGIVCLLLALCTIASYFNSEGIFLKWFAAFLKGCFGSGYFLCAAALIWAGILLLRKNRAHIVLRLICTALLPFVFGAVFHLLLCKESFAFALTDIKALWAAGTALTAGGVLSGSIAAGMIALLGNAVSLVVLLLAFIALLLGALPLTPKELWTRYCDYQASRYEEEEEPLFDDGQFMAPEPKIAPKKRRVSIHIPLDGEDDEDKNELVEPFTKEKKGFLKPKEDAVLTPAQALDPSVKVEIKEAPPVAPQPAEEKAPASRKVRTAQEVEEATKEVSAAIEKELSEEEPTYSYPPITLLDVNTSNNSSEVGAELRLNAQRLGNALQSFGVDAKPGEVIHGPSVTRYEFMLDSGVKLSKLTNLSDDIALALGASGVRIAPIPGKISAVGIEVPNRAVTAVRIRDVLESRNFVGHESTTAFAVGKDIGGNAIVGNIARLPHVLIAGTTGSGKSVCTNSLIVSLLYKSTPDEVRFIMVDPKMVELAPYNGIPHLLIPVVTDPKKAAGALQWAVFEMMKRYKMFSEKGVKDLSGYNALCDNPVTAEEGMKKLPTVVVVIDELADLMLVAAKEVEESICRVAQMGRAAGMHLVIATQRPSADVITGLMKANIPSRIAFAVASSLESRIILDTTGAEKLVGKGDMLYFPLGDTKPTRVQGCFITPEEIERVVSFVKESGEVHYDQTVMDKIEEALKKDEKGGSSGKAEVSGNDDGADELLSAAVEVVLETGQASVSMLQRRLKLGYSRAARLVDQMEERGFVGPFEGSKPRQLLITREQWQELQMKGAAAAPAEEPAPIDRYGSIRDTFESRDALE